VGGCGREGREATRQAIQGRLQGTRQAGLRADGGSLGRAGSQWRQTRAGRRQLRAASERQRTTVVGGLRMGALQRSVGAERYESGRAGGRAWRAEKHQSERAKGVPPCRIVQSSNNGQRLCRNAGCSVGAQLYVYLLPAGGVSVLSTQGEVESCRCCWSWSWCCCRRT